MLFRQNNMKWLAIWLVVMAGSGLAGAVVASSVGNHPVNIDFLPINEITISGSPSLSVDSAIAGSEPLQADNNASSYSISTNGSNRTITALIDATLPAQVTMTISLLAPSASGTSLGDVQLTTTAANAVTGISQTAQSGIAVSYSLSATVAAGVVSATMRNTTLTVQE